MRSYCAQYHNTHTHNNNNNTQQKHNTPAKQFVLFGREWLFIDLAVAPTGTDKGAAWFEYAADLRQPVEFAWHVLPRFQAPHEVESLVGERCAECVVNLMIIQEKTHRFTSPVSYVSHPTQFISQALRNLKLDAAVASGNLFGNLGGSLLLVGAKRDASHMHFKTACCKRAEHESRRASNPTSHVQNCQSAIARRVRYLVHGKQLLHHTILRIKMLLFRP